MPWPLQILYLSVSLVPSIGLARADAQQVFAQWLSIHTHQRQSWPCSRLAQSLALLRGHLFPSAGVSFSAEGFVQVQRSELLPIWSVQRSRGRAVIGELGRRNWACPAPPLPPCSRECAAWARSSNSGGRQSLSSAAVAGG